MQSPELIDERFAEIVAQLRTLPGAPETLRERVRELAAPEPPPAPRWWSRFRPRGTGLTFATAAAALAVIAIGFGVITSGGGRNERTAAELSTTSQRDRASAEFGAEAPGSAGARPPQATATIEASPQPAPPPPPGTGVDSSTAQSAAPAVGSGQRGAVTLPPSKRLAQYTASMRLRVADVDELSHSTREAMRIARSLGGFVAGVQYATPEGDDGDATLTLRVPSSNVQRAIVRLSNLGVILSQHIALQDVQDSVNRQTSDIGRLLRQIHRIQTRLQQPLSEEERYRLELQLTQARESLKSLTQQREQTVRRARLAKITVALTTREAKVVPSAPGQIERAARNAVSLLSNAAAGAIWVLILASPLILLGVAALVGGRARRRRFEQRLLEQA